MFWKDCQHSSRFSSDDIRQQLKDWVMGSEWYCVRGTSTSDYKYSAGAICSQLLRLKGSMPNSIGRCILCLVMSIG